MGDEPTAMTPAPSEQAVFAEAILCATPAARAAYLDGACGADTALRQRVEALLRASECAGDFLEQPPTGLAVGGGSTLVVTGLSEKPGDRIGRYKLLQQIGEGGCGVVYMAEQEQPVRRRVALKIIKLGMDTKQVVARFEAEGQALAMMDHPNIAKVFDAGATNTGRPYFVMELVRGVKITDYCDQNHLPTEDRLKLFTQVCHAIQHAHQKGIIHRDIKPSNILVTVNDGLPVPKVIDFGIAKAIEQRLTDKTVFTAFEQFIGTPAYMSPEQAEMTSLDIDTRADIYSLGVLLYELLSGNTPFDAQTLVASGVAEIRRIIREQEPPKPSTRLNTLSDADLSTVAQHRRTDSPRLKHLIRGDLDWIVMKCLEKDRTRRYETANGLAIDLQRHLDNEPVVARPPTNLYRFQKLVRRNKLAFAASAAVLLVLLGGIAASTWQAIRATRAEREQTRLREQAETARNNEARERANAGGNEKRAASEAAKSQQVARFLKDMLIGIGPSVALGRDTTMLREIVDKTSERVGADLTNQPAVEADLRRTIGHVYFNLGELDQAESMHREALAIERKLFGNDDPAINESLHSLSGTLWKVGKLSEAETLIREKLAIQKRSLGDDDFAIFDSLYLLGHVLWNQGKLTEAESIQRTVLAHRRKKFGNDHYETADLLTALGVVLCDQGKLAEAEATHREALAIQRKLLGNEHPAVSISLRNLGRVFLSRKRFAEAEAVDREALAINRKMLGAQHFELVASLVELARALVYQNQWPEAERLLREAAVISQKALLYNPMDWNYAVQTLTDLLTLEGKGGEAERILNETLNHAETVYRDALAAKRKAWPNDPSQWQTMLIGLSGVFHAQGKLAEDEALLLSGYESMKQQEDRIPAASKGYVKETLQRLVQLYEATGQSEKAAEWKTRLAEFDRTELEKQAIAPKP